MDVIMTFADFGTREVSHVFQVEVSLTSKFPSIVIQYFKVSGVVEIVGDGLGIISLRGAPPLFPSVPLCSPLSPLKNFYFLFESTFTCTSDVLFVLPLDLFKFPRKDKKS